MAAVSPVFAQAPIVDLSDGSSVNRGSATPPPPSYPQLASRTDTSASRLQANPQAEAYYQMQVLQQEVQELRGAVEELKHEVKRLRQQRTEDYMDLDRRIARISGEAPSSGAPDGEASNGANGSASDPVANTGGTAPGGQKSTQDEQNRYSDSIGLARKGDYSAASKGLKSLLDDFPNGQYAPNANYWLGEIALVQGQVEEARTWFVALLDGYPNSSKVWDGRYKLGTVYHQLGDNAKAKELLEQVAASDARASRLAKEYLKENLP
ncbi:tetratricopeptide repeat protein [Microbulbifer sp. CAU 1566]|uniref:YbgF trimerization domain-containing protein n=1 Tax=Microbulbifer sp. CAU 1566 TaxID=2933269 RepID=UPI002004F170|nr:YbgF trimerization domain-containing protein [Microbulbifer sp. CAU 1566]MCK7596028.1 tetratricopeptide repeat protein [Microbulbifer sp. CAU 1566]